MTAIRLEGGGTFDYKQVKRTLPAYLKRSVVDKCLSLVTEDIEMTSLRMASTKYVPVSIRRRRATPHPAASTFIVLRKYTPLSVDSILAQFVRSRIRSIITTQQYEHLENSNEALN